MNEALSRYAEERLGIVIGYTPKHTELFFIRADIRDILDIVTFIYAFSLHLERQHFSTTRFAQLWHDHVSLALKEENMGYRLDDSGVVHYHIDEEFERNRVSTIAALGDVRYTSVLEAYNSAYRHMDHPMDTKAAVRSMFEALEILAKKMVDTSNLNKWLLENDRSPLRAKFFSLHGTSTNQKVVSGMLNSFAEWVNTTHKYRHGQADEEPVIPTEEIVVYMLSSGSSFLRWMIDVDMKTSGN